MASIRLLLLSAAFTFGVGSTAAFGGTGLNLSAKGAKTFTVSNKAGNSQAQFSSQAPLENIEGGTAAVTGSFTLDPANLEATTGKIIIPVASMQTGIEMRDKHLKEKDWLDAEAHPNIIFEVKKLSGVTVTSSSGGKGVAKALAEGTFTMHGVTKPMSVPVEITYVEKASGDIVMVRVDQMAVPIREYGIQGRKGIIGSKVSETITVKVTIYAGA
jgi:polyisoprenoid-binding protein YceI